MLPEFADMGAAETPVGAGLAFGLRNEMGEMAFDIILHRRAGSLEGMQPLHFVGDELEIGRTLQGQETREECDDFSGPCLAMVATTGRGLIAGLVLEPFGAKDIEPRPAYVQAGCGAGGVDHAAVEVSQDASNKSWRQAVNKLFLFIRRLSDKRHAPGNPALLGALPHMR